MKKTFFCSIAILLSTLLANAQAPQKLSYQAVVRNSTNNLILNTKVGMRLSVLQGSVSGTTVYVETQTPTTNINGLISIEIGGGVNVSGSFSSIEWSKGPYFVKTEIDPNNGSNYTITSVSQLLSVPFALFAENSSTSIYQSKHISSIPINFQAWTVIDSLIVTNDGDYLLTWNVVSSDIGDFGFNKNQTSNPGFSSPYLSFGYTVGTPGVGTTHQPGYFTGSLTASQLKKNDIIYILGWAENYGVTFGDAGNTWGDQSQVSLIKIK